MAHYHAVVWLDHNEVQAMHFTPEEVQKAAIHAKEQLLAHARKYFRAADRTR